LYRTKNTGNKSMTEPNKAVSAIWQRFELNRENLLNALGLLLGVFFGGLMFLSGMLIPTRKLMVIFLSIITLAVVAGVSYAYYGFVFLRDPLGSKLEDYGSHFLLDSLAFEKFVAVGFSFPLLFLAGYVAQHAWNAQLPSKKTVMLCIVSLGLFVVGTFPERIFSYKVENMIVAEEAEARMTKNAYALIATFGEENPEIGRDKINKLTGDIIASQSSFCVRHADNCDVGKNNFDQQYNEMPKEIKDKYGIVYDDGESK